MLHLASPFFSNYICVCCVISAYRLAHYFLWLRPLITDLHAKCRPVRTFTWEWRGHVAEGVMTNECWAWVVACHRNVPGVCFGMKNSVWPWDGWLKPEPPPPRLNVGRMRKAPPSSFLFCVFSLSPPRTCYSSRSDVEKGKKEKEWERTLLPCPSSAFSSHFHRMWTQTLRSLGARRLPCLWAWVNVNMAAEGAKTEVWLRGIRSVNIMADWLHEEKERTVERLFTDQQRNLRHIVHFYSVKATLLSSMSAVIF